MTGIATSGHDPSRVLAPKAGEDLALTFAVAAPLHHLKGGPPSSDGRITSPE